MQTLTGLKERTKWAIDCIAEKNNLNNAQIGSVVGSKPDTVRKYRSGLSAPRMVFLESFCDHFGVDFLWLSKGEGGPFPEQDDQTPVEKDVPETEKEVTDDREASLSDFERSGEDSNVSDNNTPNDTLLPGPSVVTGIDSEMSFQKLAILAGIKIDTKWILKLSEKIGVESWKISLLIYQQQIDSEIIQHIEDCGYRSHEWLIKSESKTSVVTKNSRELNVSQLLKITETVLRSNTIHSASLALNIISMKAFADEASSLPVMGGMAISLPEKKSVLLK